jgi:Zn finger protein HypA/HybF involved in hydrogenase expression
MERAGPRGRVYWCPVCGAEVAIISFQAGDFRPRCCNTDMRVKPDRLVFFVCPVCKAEVAVVRAGQGVFEPRCCNVAMVRAD